ncbi:MAG TPA: zinc-dependent alcohol dehydrogenase family protein [Sporosarcina psychrophila]|uniref:Zinc-dependent alcohol dehydrogenase family protein n=1 Tax=Sporosarcina psychrophila TaxID=1476 RepID=A0A921KC54_SPOPS|nr:zinc-dependent alcohol dehydrogenase family protein [Sporosarcina psychrophila]
MLAKCITFHEFGNPQDVLTVEDKIIQPIVSGEVLVRMKLCPINPSDLIPIKGAYSHRISLPGIPGYEGVGIIEDVGRGISRELIGRRVLPLRGEGTWQELVKTSVDLAVPLPNAIDDFTGAQLYINPLTAWIICTEELKLKPGDTLLVNACGSAIGRIFAQLAKILGFRLIAVTRTNIYTEELLQLGAAHVVNTSETSLLLTVWELTNGYGATAAIDSIGGAAGTALAFCVRTNGILITIGLISGEPINWADISNKAKVHVKLFHLRHWNQRVSVETWQKTFYDVIQLIQNKKLRLMEPGFQFNLMDMKQAIRMADSSKGIGGKVFLTSG